MKPLYYLNGSAMTALMLQQMLLQQQLIESQQHIIDLQKKIDNMTPKNAKDKDIFWHLNSDGVSSVAAAQSDDLTTLRQFMDWNVRFAEKFIKPYVNPKAYGECLNQMTRGLPERVAALQTKEDLKTLRSGARPTSALLRYAR